MSLRNRSAQRKRRIVAHRAKNFADAERWDLQYWQQQKPEVRLSALVAIHADVKAVAKPLPRKSARR